MERSLQIRRGQQKERATLLIEIGSAQSRIARLNEERAPIAAEVRKVEAEVGPIKYIAALLYEDSADTNTLEDAVRIVILLIVSVFDPLAVLLLIAANWQLNRQKPVSSPVNPQITDAVTQVAEPIYVADVTMPEPIEEPTYTEEYPAKEEHQKPISYDSAGRRITP